ncbi:unnamed protein product, partial [Trichogramma brassicae]
MRGEPETDHGVSARSMSETLCENPIGIDHEFWYMKSKCYYERRAAAAAAAAMQTNEHKRRLMRSRAQSSTTARTTTNTTTRQMRIYPNEDSHQREIEREVLKPQCPALPKERRKGNCCRQQCHRVSRVFTLVCSLATWAAVSLLSSPPFFFFYTRARKRLNAMSCFAPHPRSQVSYTSAFTSRSPQSWVERAAAGTAEACGVDSLARSGRGCLLLPPLMGKGKKRIKNPDYASTSETLNKDGGATVATISFDRGPRDKNKKL